jgi:ABC-type phosphate/phosphonate transport system substrate-binding protein
MRVGRFAIIVCPLAVGLAVAGTPAAAELPRSPVRIGILAGMFKNMNPALRKALAQSFQSLVESQTGLKSEALVVPTADELRTQMEAGRIHFGIFHGFEFAWAKQRTPPLKPLMIAASRHGPIRSFLVVHCGSTATDLAGLRGKTLALPTSSREHSRLFLERSCKALGGSPETFFGRITGPKTAEDALHDLADNREVEATVADASAMQGFSERYPGRAKRIKVIATSEEFPPTTVAYRERMVDADVINRFREGMSHAHTTPLGRQLLSLWQLTGFEPIPADYPKVLSDIAKAYPPPREK